MWWVKNMVGERCGGWKIWWVKNMVDESCGGWKMWWLKNMVGERWGGWKIWWVKDMLGKAMLAKKILVEQSHWVNPYSGWTITVGERYGGWTCIWVNMYEGEHVCGWKLYGWTMTVDERYGGWTITVSERYAGWTITVGEHVYGLIARGWKLCGWKLCWPKITVVEHGCGSKLCGWMLQWLKPHGTNSTLISWFWHLMHQNFVGLDFVAIKACEVKLLSVKKKDRLQIVCLVFCPLMGGLIYFKVGYLQSWIWSVPLIFRQLIFCQPMRSRTNGCAALIWSSNILSGYGRSEKGLCILKMSA